MLNDVSVQLGINLSNILADRKKSINTVNGSLLSELTNAVGNKLVFSNDPSAPVLDINNNIVGASTGSAIDGKYISSDHDIVMDNYINELTTLVSNHVSYARSVVYSKMETYLEEIKAALTNYTLKAAEDFFCVNYYKLPDICKSDLVQSEVVPFYGHNIEMESITFGDIIGMDFDIVSYILTGDEDTDTMIKSWVAETGKDTILHYVTSKSRNEVVYLNTVDQINYNLANFLFFRSLAIKQDITFGLGTVALISTSTNNRDYFAAQLAANISFYESCIRNGVLLSTDSSVKFSYLSTKDFPIVVYEEVFNQAVEKGFSIEHIFGYIAKTNRSDLTLDILDAQGETFINAWNNVKSLYALHINNNRIDIAKLTIKMLLPSVLDKDLTEDEIKFYEENQGFKEKTIELANGYIDTLDNSDLDDLVIVVMNIIAKIAYRQTSAYDIIKEMHEIMVGDTNVDAKQAALLSTIKYVTDFCMSQLEVVDKTYI